MILLLGSSGYVGTAFRKMFDARNIPYQTISRADSGGYDSAKLIDLVRSSGSNFLINAAGFTGKPNVDSCEIQKAECLMGNAVLPGTVRAVCEATGIPWGHVSSGCIFSGRGPEGAGFSEDDVPNFTFRTNNSSFYSGSKALGEEILAGAEQNYIWRLRIPFDHRDNPRNYISKLLNYDTLLNAENSISHLGDFVQACYTSWEKKVPFGIYNLTNSGSITTRMVVDLIRKHLRPAKDFQFFPSEEEFMKVAAKAPRSNCCLDTSKSQAAGVAMRPVLEALEDALKNWSTVELMNPALKAGIQ